MSSSDPQPPYEYDPYSGQPHPYQPEYGRGYPQPIPMSPYGYEYPPVPYGQPPDNRVRGWAIGALVANIAITMLCCSPLGIAGIVVSALAMGRVDDQPDSARTLLRWGWGLAIASVVLVVLFVIGVVVVAVVSEPQ